MFGMLGKKMGMTQHFKGNGDLVPVTMIECGPCTVIQRKTLKKEGYNAIQLGFSNIEKLQRVGKAKKGHFQRAKTPIFSHLGEYRMNDIEMVKVGNTLKVDLFKIGDRLNVRGRTIGRGFQGVIKRHGKSGGGASHGSHFHRTPGSIGMCTSPARVIKNMKLPGQMGNVYRTIKNVEIIDIDVENNLLFVKGSVPGSKNGLLRITNAYANLKDRLPLEEKKEEKAEAAQAEAAPQTEKAGEVKEVKEETKKTEEKKEEKKNA